MIFKVTWEIEVDAESPKQAAEWALTAQTDPDSLARVFDVESPDGTKTQIDLLEAIRGYL